ncbi:MAG: hypothetical protein ACRD12_20165, partial [Acidimicrobiales bacterium]
VEPAGTTAARLATVGPGADPALDGWIVPNPWPEVVDERRRTASLPPLLAVEGQPLGRSPLGIAVWKERAQRLAAVCGTAITWKCLGDAAVANYWFGVNDPWAAIEFGRLDPDTDAMGLLVLGQAVSSYFGTATVATNDLDADDRFPQWFAALKRHSIRGDTPLTEMLITNGAKYDAVGTVRAEAPANDMRVDLLYPEPMATADVVLATAGTSNARAARRAVTADNAGKALVRAGWTAPGGPGLPPANGLPSGGLLLQLQNRWHGVAR